MGDAKKVAKELRRIGRLMEVNGENPFKSRAFGSASRTVEGVGEQLVTMVEEGRLTELRGVGSSTAEVIRDLMHGIEPAVLTELQQKIPAGVRDLLQVAGLGPKKVRAIWTELGVESLGELEYACRENRLVDLSGFGAKTQLATMEGLSFLLANREHLRIDQATDLAASLCGRLGSAAGIERIEVSGEVRRACDSVAELVLVMQAVDDKAASAALGEVLPEAKESRGSNSTEWSGHLGEGCPVRVVMASKVTFDRVLIQTTASGAHLGGLAELGWDAELSSSGPENLSEAAIYERLGCAWIPPELREGTGEIELATRGQLPKLVEASDLEGALHNHTTDSDGTATVEEMAAAAAALGWRFLGIGDHSPVAQYAHGVTDERLREQWRRIDEWNSAGHDVRVIKGLEADILADGRLDVDEAWREGLQYTVASVHTSFRLTREAQTERIITAVRHPMCRVLGHPTGRLLLTRPGYEVDLEAVLDACAESGVAVEINASPYRLDLDWRWARKALDRGLKLIINPDAHSTAGLADLRWGLLVARKAGGTVSDVVNCDFEGFLRS